MMRTPRRQRAFDMTGGLCTYCKVPLCDDENVVPAGYGGFVPPPGQRFLCVTLKTPKSAGGRASLENEVPACHDCSARKGSLGHDAFLKKLERKIREPLLNSPDGNWMRLAEALPTFVVGTPSLPPQRARRRMADVRARSF
jgi:5-methylcytosine-specific restriction endonuclease McrA